MARMESPAARPLEISSLLERKSQLRALTRGWALPAGVSDELAQRHVLPAQMPGPEVGATLRHFAASRPSAS